jgi:hypothetical protein
VQAQAYAVRISMENLQAIASEHPRFNREELKKWMALHGEGYFVRDDVYKSFDCQYLRPEVFHKIYAFENGDTEALFRKISKK